MNKKEEFKNSLFVRVFRLIKLNKKLFFLTLMFDILFIASLYFTSQLITLALTPRIESIARFFGLPVLVLLFALLFSIGYICLLIWLYSFFKYNILDLIKSMKQKTESGFRRLKSFFLLNLIMLVVGFVSFFLIGLMFLGIKSQYLPIVYLIVIIPTVLTFYSFINFAHSYFVLKHLSVKGALKHSLKRISKLSSYYKIYLITLGYILAYLAVYFLIALLMKNIVLDKYKLLGFLPIYVNVFTVITLIVFYFIIAYNRIYYYLIVEGEEQK
jgi:hypothetical protein|tara:strand:- start:386 stop:1198 length:813 start_codon:yes stop_codon:yes gene_type:complete